MAMGGLLEGKLGLVLESLTGGAWPTRFAQAFSREGATLVLTYLGEHQKDAVESLAKDLNVARIVPCDVTQEGDLAALTETLRSLGRPLDAVVHSLAFANREDLGRPFAETGAMVFWSPRKSARTRWSPLPGPPRQP